MKTEQIKSALQQLELVFCRVVLRYDVPSCAMPCNCNLCYAVLPGASLCDDSRIRREDHPDLRVLPSGSLRKAILPFSLWTWFSRRLPGAALCGISRDGGGGECGEGRGFLCVLKSLLSRAMCVLVMITLLPYLHLILTVCLSKIHAVVALQEQIKQVAARAKDNDKRSLTQLDQLQNELDGYVAADCPMCGSYMIRAIGLSLTSSGNDSQEATSWLL